MPELKPPPASGDPSRPPVPPGQPSDDSKWALWLAIAILASLGIGGVAGVLDRQSGEPVSEAVLTGGLYFAGALTLALLIMSFFRGR